MRTDTHRLTRRLMGLAVLAGLIALVAAPTIRSQPPQKAPSAPATPPAVTSSSWNSSRNTPRQAQNATSCSRGSPAARHPRTGSIYLKYGSYVAVFKS